MVNLIKTFIFRKFIYFFFSFINNEPFYDFKIENTKFNLRKNIKINNVNKSHDGIFILKAINPIGSDEISFLIKIEGKSKKA